MRNEKYFTFEKNEEEAIKSLKKALSSRFNLAELRLFGSKIRGGDTPEYVELTYEQVEPFIAFSKGYEVRANAHMQA